MSFKVKCLIATVTLICCQVFIVYHANPKTLQIAEKVVNIFLDTSEIFSLRPRVLASKNRQQIKDYFSQRAVKVTEIDCHKALIGDKKELKRANHEERSTEESIPSDSSIAKEASNCSSFIMSYGFITDPLTEMENNFPLAYSILIYKQASQVVHLLKAVYRPQNFYCIHVDLKSSQHLHKALKNVANCFPNVFLASRTISVHWGNYTVLEPEIVCMQDLWRNKTWKYFINLTGQEFPLKTNYELVRILRTLKGANDVDGNPPNKATINYRWKKFLPSPHNISLFKGAAHVVVSRGFVDYVLHKKEAQDFLQWCKQTRHPDEHFFNSLHLNPQLKVPGAYRGNKSRITLVRYKSWVHKSPCPGKKIVRGICILSVLDLPALYQSKKFFANKFHADYSHFALKCLAETIYNRTRDQTLGRLGFNVSYYKHLTFFRDTFI